MQMVLKMKKERAIEKDRPYKIKFQPAFPSKEDEDGEIANAKEPFVHQFDTLPTLEQAREVRVTYL